MKALVFSAVLNGFVAVPLIFLIAQISSNRRVMGRYTSGYLSRSLTWLAFIGMLASAVSTIYLLVAGH
jgi:Mn2+/Fe2+ NRAMP family transporter